MSLRLSRFSVITFTAGAMSAAFAHLLELPAKMRYDKTQHVKLHRTLYWNFGSVSGLSEALRKRNAQAFPLTASAAGALAAAHGVLGTGRASQLNDIELVFRFDSSRLDPLTRSVGIHTRGPGSSDEFLALGGDRAAITTGKGA